MVLSLVTWARGLAHHGYDRYERIPVATKGISSSTHTYFGIPMKQPFNAAHNENSSRTSTSRSRIPENTPARLKPGSLSSRMAKAVDTDGLPERYSSQPVRLELGFELVK